MKRKETVEPLPEVWLAVMEQSRREGRCEAAAEREVQAELQRVADQRGRAGSVRSSLDRLRASAVFSEAMQARELMAALRGSHGLLRALCLPEPRLRELFGPARHRWARHGAHLYLEVGGHWLRHLPDSETGVVRLSADGEVPVTGPRDLLAPLVAGLELQVVDTRMATVALGLRDVLALVSALGFPMFALLCVVWLLADPQMKFPILVPFFMITVPIPLLMATDIGAPLLIAWQARRRRGVRAQA